MKVSFEVVPRTAQAFSEQYDFALSLGSAIHMINVPDLQRFAIRSWDTAKYVDRTIHQFVPHFRAADFSVASGDLFKIIEQNELNRVLLVSGDPPEVLRKVHNTNVLDLIAATRKRFPKLTIYAGFDPYRSGLQDECDYIFRKRDAGANSFFSQPFYDSRSLEIYAEQLQKVDIFIGLSPITTTASKNYWTVKNKVKFPSTFEPTYRWNIDFSNRVIALASELNFNLYFMPIKIDLAVFFAGVKLPTQATGNNGVEDNRV